MGKIIARKSTETRTGCHSVSELFSTVVIRSFVPIFVAGLAETPFNDGRLKGMMVTQNSNINLRTVVKLLYQHAVVSCGVDSIIMVVNIRTYIP